MILRNVTVFCVAVVTAFFIGLAASIFNGDWQFLMWVVSLFLVGGLSFAFLVFIDKDYPR